VPERELCESLMGEGKYQKLNADERYGAAKNVAQQYQDIFGKNNFYLEIQDQGWSRRRRFMRRCSGWSGRWDSAGADE